MDDKTLNGLLHSSLVTSNHLQCALESLATVHSHFRTIIHQRRLPDTSLPDAFIQLFMAQLAALDSNNFPSHVGAGEREGRVFSSLVSQRHYNMSHGVGRSGELDSHQPKAAGMSLLYPLCNLLALDVCRAVGFAANKRAFEEALVVPLSTGMTLALVLRSIANDTVAARRKAYAAAMEDWREEQKGREAQSAEGEVSDANVDSSAEAEAAVRPPSPPVAPQYVVWCRIDQKTCLKCIAGAGLEPIVVNLRPAPAPKEKRRGDALKKNGAKQHTKKNTNVSCNDVSQLTGDASMADGCSSSSDTDACSTSNLSSLAGPPSTTLMVPACGASVSGGGAPAFSHTQEKKAGDANPPTSASPPPSSSTNYFMQSHVDDVRAAIESCPGGPQAVAAVLTTTSCFAPRLPDDVLGVARLCKAMGVPHVVNNAYGLQSKHINAMIDAASREGRIDAVVQSTDKNFMVPVGGAIVVGPSATVRSASKLYPGRASSSPIVDLFITLLAMGKARYLSLAHTDRYHLLQNVFRPKVEAFAARRGEEVVWDDRNDISFGMTLRYAHCGGNGNVTNAQQQQSNNKNDVVDTKEGSPDSVPPPPSSPTTATTKAMVDAAIAIGSKLFHLGVTGPKVVYPTVKATTAASSNGAVGDGAAVAATSAGISASKTVSSITFKSYGMHGSDEAVRLSDGSGGAELPAQTVPPMIIFACAIGMQSAEVEGFLRRLEEVYPGRCPSVIL